MWSAVIAGLTEVVRGWFETKREKQKAEAKSYEMALKGEQDWDMEAMRQARYSWKDEFITAIWFAPLIVAWFDPEKAMQWVEFVSEMPVWYQFGMFGILAASFGLRWYFKRETFRIPGNKRKDE